MFLNFHFFLDISGVPPRLECEIIESLIPDTFRLEKTGKKAGIRAHEHFKHVFLICSYRLLILDTFCLKKTERMLGIWR
jgi:hypothetical protein